MRTLKHSVAYVVYVTSYLRVSWGLGTRFCASVRLCRPLTHWTQFPAARCHVAGRIFKGSGVAKKRVEKERGRGKRKNGRDLNNCNYPTGVEFDRLRRGGISIMRERLPVRGLEELSSMCRSTGRWHCARADRVGVLLIDGAAGWGG